MKPKIKPNVVYLPIEEGVIFKGGNGLSVLKGKDIYLLIRKLAPFLDGEHTLEEITINSNELNSKVIVKVINILFDKGFIYDVSQDQTKLTNEVSKRFSKEIAFIHSYISNPESLFEEFRNTRLLIIGRSRLIFPTIWGLINVGSKYIDYSFTHQTNDVSKEKFYNKLSNDDFLYKNVVINEIKIDSIGSDIYDLVLYIEDCNHIQHVIDTNQKKMAKNLPFIPTVYGEGGAFIGSISKRYCWKCVWSRSGKLLEGSYPQFANEQTKIMYFSNSVSFEIFRYLTKIEGYKNSNVLLLNFDEFSQQQIYIPPIKNCKKCCSDNNEELITENHNIEFDEMGNKMEQREPFLEKVLKNVVGEHTGILKDISFGDLEQLPVQQCSVSLCGNHSDSQFITVGENHKMAMYNAVIKGLEEYAYRESINQTVRKVFNLNNQILDLNADVDMQDFIFACGHSLNECFINGIGKVEVTDIINNGRKFQLISSNEFEMTDTINFYLSLIKRKTNKQMEFIEFATRYPISIIGHVIDNKVMSISYHSDKKRAALIAVIQSLHQLQSNLDIQGRYDYKELQYFIEFSNKRSNRDKEIVYVPWEEDIYLLEKLQVKIFGFKKI